MEQRRLGNTGLQISPIVLGMMSYGDPGWRDWVLDEQTSVPLIERALELGFTTFDTADMYSRGVSEEVTGRLVLSRADREDVVIATKCFFGTADGPNRSGLSRKAVLAACDASLRRLGTDYIDLYQIHRWDAEVPIEETMGALASLVEHGKVRYLGASSMAAWQFAKAQRVAAEHGWPAFVSLQPQYNLLYREEEREILPLCADQGIGVIPWSPLARGRLTRPSAAAEATTRGEVDGISRHLYDDAADEIVAAVERVAARHEVAMAQIALAWVVAHPTVSAPIIGATRIGHLDDAVAALDVQLSEDDLADLESAYVPRPVIDHGPGSDAAARGETSRRRVDR